MPVIKSAKKKLKQDKKREKTNKLLKTSFKNAIKEAQRSKTAAKILNAVKLVDKVAKKRIIHKNKAARIKSSLSKLIKSPVSKTSSARTSTKKKNS